MKKIYVLIFLIFGSFFANVNAQLLQWNTFGNAGTETTEPSIFNDPNLSGITNLTLGPGITGASNTHRFGGNNWWNTGNSVNSTLSEAIAGNDYIQFIVTPNGGFSFTPTSFVFNWDHSASGPNSVALRSSADGFVANLGIVSGMPASISTGNTITITGLTSLTVATTFRLYGYGGTATGGTGGFDVASSVVNVQLNGTTAASGGPTINVTPSSLSGFTALSGVPSAEQNYSVDGTGLTANITITPPAGFEISPSTAPFVPTSPITLTQSGGIVNPTTIYVRMNSATLGTNTGNITHTSTGANNPNVGLTGHVIATEPTVQSAITIPGPTVTTTTMVVNFSGGDGAKRILVARSGSAVNSDPVDGTTYTANANFTSGTQIGTGNYVVYAGTGNTVVVTGLSPTTTYHFAVYEYNDAGIAGAENYLTVLPGTGNATTISTDGDYRSISSGNWSDIAIWQMRVTNLWVPAAIVPLPTSNVYIQAAHTVVVDVPIATCNDLHFSNAPAILTIGSNTIEVNGKLRVYVGAAVTTLGADGTFYSGQVSTGTVPNNIISSTAGLGKMKVVGNTRVFTATGEWGNNPPGWDVEFAPTAGETLTIQTGFKAANITVASGTVLSTASDLRPDGGGAGLGSLTVRSGAALQFSNNFVTIQRIGSAGITAHFGTLTVEAGGVLEFSGTSSPVIAAAALALNGTVVYSGAGNQTLAAKGANSAASDPNTYTNLTFSGGGNKTLPFATTVNGVLNLISGIVVTTATNLLTMGVASSVTGASNASYVIGQVKKMGNTPFTFPVGKANGYVPLRVSNFTGASAPTDEFTAEYVRASGNALGPITDAFINRVSSCEYWTLNVNNGTPTVDLTLYWNANNPCNGAYISNVADIEIAHFDGASWNSSSTGFSSKSGTTAAGDVTWSSVSTFSPFTIASTTNANPLPITINYFNGTKNNGNHLLNWKVTCVSTPSATIEMERSTDGRNYSSIYSIFATAVRCQQPFNYSDNQPAKGINYYRLKMTDADGKITYSTTVALINAVKGIEVMNIAPNPIVNGAFIVKISTAEKIQVELVITDMQGRILQKQAVPMIAGFNQIPVNVRNLAAGTYQLFGHTAEGRTRVLRFVIQ